MIQFNLKKTWPGFSLQLELEIPAGITVISGPSGCGKTTLLKMIAGLIEPDEGLVILKDRCLFDPKKAINVPAYERNIGFVFQEDRLFPHLSIKSNLLFGAPKVPKREQKMTELAQFLGISSLLDRKPLLLSGGEQKRVAIGRAILREPDLMLMDEPLSSLDPARKAELLPYIKTLSDHYQTPLLYVTHDEYEAEQLGGMQVCLSSQPGT